MITGKTTEVLKSEIDWEDFSFRFGKKDKKEELAESIDRYGILDTPTVVKGKGKFKIFSGFNRLESLKKNQNLFSVIIINEVTEELLKKEAGEKSFNDRIGISGKIRLCEIYEKYFSRNFKALEDIGKYIGGIPIDFFPGKENFSKLAGFSEEFKDYLDEKDVSFKVVRSFLSISSSIQKILIPHVIQWNPGKNNFKKLINVILDIEQQGEIQNLLDSLNEIEEKGEPGSFDKFYAGLSMMRYPAYTEMVAEKDRLLKMLQIPSIHFVVPEFFEGDEIILQARIKRNEKPEDVIEKINRLDKELIVRLLHLL